VVAKAAKAEAIAVPEDEMEPPSLISSVRYSNSLEWVNAKHANGGHFPKSIAESAAKEEATEPPQKRDIAGMEVFFATLGLLALTKITFHAMDFRDELKKKEAARLAELQSQMEEVEPMDDGPRRGGGGIRPFKSQVAPQDADESKEE